MKSTADQSEYYYEQNGEREGPLAWGELVELASRGEVSDGTLVWTEGMADWTSYQEVLAAGDSLDPVVECTFSGEQHPRSRMLPFGENWVAPEHKEEFVQLLTEGSAMEVCIADGYSFQTDMRLYSLVLQSWRIWKEQALEILLLTAIVWIPLSIMTEFLVYEVLSEDPDN